MRSMEGYIGEWRRKFELVFTLNPKRLVYALGCKSLLKYGASKAEPFQVRLDARVSSVELCV